MSSKKYISIALIGVVFLSAWNTLFIFPTADTATQQISNNLVDDKNLDPLQASYYKTLVFNNPHTNQISGYSGLTFLDVCEDNTYYYATGYAINDTDSKKSIVVQRIPKATGNFDTSRVYRISTNPFNDSIGLTIDTDGTYLYLGGCAEKNYTGYTAGLGWSSIGIGYDTYLRGFIMKISKSDFSTVWEKIIYQATDINNFYLGNTVQDIVVLPDGNITITGSSTVFPYSTASPKYWYDYLYVSKIDSDNGQFIWNYTMHENFGVNDNPTSEYKSSVGTRIVYNADLDQLYILGILKYEDGSRKYRFITFTLCLTLENTVVFNSLTSGRLSETSPATLGLSRFIRPTDLTFTMDNQLYICGTNQSSTTNLDSQIIWKVNPANGIIENTYSLPYANRTASRIAIDVDNTIYLVGNSWSNTSSNAGLLSVILDPSRNMYEINRTVYRVSDTNNMLNAGIFNQEKREWFIIGYRNTIANWYGMNHQLITSTIFGVETLTSLPIYSNNATIRLSWTHQYADIYKFKLYRQAYNPITDVNLATLIATLENQYNYTDTIAPVDLVHYYYALVSLNDNITETTQYSTTSTQYYTPPAKPQVTFSPNYVRHGTPMNFDWTAIQDANLEVYISQNNFTTSDFWTTLAPTYKNMNSANTSIDHLFPYIGKYYVQFNAYSTTRGNRTSDLYEVWCSNIPTQVTGFNFTIESSDDGNVHLIWDVAPLANVSIYRRLGQSFSFDQIPNAEIVKVADVRNPVRYYDITNLGSGSWYFGLLAFNETGTATQLSTVKNIVIRRTCIQPTPQSRYGLGSENGSISIYWTRSEGATRYQVYRAIKTSQYDRILELSGATLVANTTGTTFNETATEDMKYYVYVVIAVNENGYRELDPTKYVSILVKFGDLNPFDEGLTTGLIIAGSILAVAIGAYLVWKKKNPYM